jgi:CheY-like chemotaxis protein
MKAAGFRVLLAEDDAVSQAFLCQAIEACGGTPSACADGPSALARARASRWDLLVFDHHLPGLAGDAVLAALRSDPDGGSRLPPAIATTADPAGARATLLRAGFVKVLAKPLALEELRATLAEFGCHPNALDDDAALRACGSPSVALRLRRLFANQELPRIQSEIEAAAGDRQALRPMLHRLRASCGFCGATSLARASEALHDALTRGDPGRVEAAFADFDRALGATRVALDTYGAEGD